MTGWYVWVRSSKSEEPNPKVPLKEGIASKEEAEEYLAKRVVQHSPWLEYGVDKKEEV